MNEKIKILTISMFLITLLSVFTTSGHCLKEANNLEGTVTVFVEVRAEGICTPIQALVTADNYQGEVSTFLPVSEDYIIYSASLKPGIYLIEASGVDGYHDDALQYVNIEQGGDGTSIDHPLIITLSKSKTKVVLFENLFEKFFGRTGLNFFQSFFK